MRKRDSIKRLNNAVDLLAMMEQLVDGLSRDSGRSSGVPWGGIRLTLRQTKSLILHACEGMSDDDVTFDHGECGDETETEISQNLALSTLARRIKKAPISAGRIRELTGSPGKNGVSSNGNDFRRQQSPVDYEDEATYESNES